MNTNFQEYTTSGAFNLSLSRTQVSALSMLSEIGDAGCSTYQALGALWRKGLIKDTTGMNDMPSGPVEITAAGHHVISLVNMAGLTNSPPSNYDAAFDDRLEEVRQLAHQNHRLAQDNLALQDQINSLHSYIKILKEKMGSAKPTIYVGNLSAGSGDCFCKMAETARASLETT